MFRVPGHNSGFKSRLIDTQSIFKGIYQAIFPSLKYNNVHELHIFFMVHILVQFFPSNPSSASYYSLLSFNPDNFFYKNF